MRIKALTFLGLFAAYTLPGQEKEIRISENLKLTALSEHAYMHTCQNNNGLVYINHNEAIVVSTPDSDTETQHLIDWVQNERNAKIVGYIINCWHPDAMEGLDVVQQNGIKSYAYELTRKIALNKELPVPDIGFDPKIEIEVGKSRVVCHFLGKAHTSDGIVVWIPDEKLLFGGNAIRSDKGWVGNIGDASLEEWPATAQRIKKAYGNANLVIPGHGKYGGAELIDYTIDLYQKSVWGPILREHNVMPHPVFNDYGDYFEVADSVSESKGTRVLYQSIFFAKDSSRYIKIKSPLIQHQPLKHRIDSDFGRLWIYRTASGKEILETDIYYKKLIIIKVDDAVGFRIIMKEMVH